MVTLSKQTVKKQSGKTYRYWILRWMGSDGKRHCQSLGRANKRSKRQAEALRRMKEAELQGNPGRRDVSRGHTLSVFLEAYFKSRKDELARGTIALQKQTARYLESFLGSFCRIDAVTRLDARAFKTVLSSDELMHVSKRPRPLKPATVDLHIRNARAFFNHALRDDLILFNPFDRLGSSQPVERDCHSVGAEEFARLLRAVSTMSWRLLLALARWAALRRGEALNLRWQNIDWDRNLLTVISSDDWEVKDKEPRVVPICPELHGFLLDAFEQALEGDRYVIPQGSISIGNIWRDFGGVCKRAGLDRYAKPIHTLRKSCITDWAGRYAFHVVKEWAGHSSIETTERHYLKVPEGEYERAASTETMPEVTKLLGKLRGNMNKSPDGKDSSKPQLDGAKVVKEKTSDGDPTGDAQLTQLGVMRWSMGPAALPSYLECDRQHLHLASSRWPWPSHPIPMAI